jgi:hypothetical protein
VSGDTAKEAAFVRLGQYMFGWLIDPNRYGLTIMRYQVCFPISLGTIECTRWQSADHCCSL